MQPVGRTPAERYTGLKQWQDVPFTVRTRLNLLFTQRVEAVMWYYAATPEYLGGLTPVAHVAAHGPTKVEDLLDFLLRGA